MTKPRKDTDYLFLSARIRSLEKDLLTSQRLEQLLQSPSVENCSQLLSDLGYAPIRDEASLQSSLKRQREAVFAELERFMPEKQLLDVFRIKYDYHNIKVLLKAPEGAERLLMDAGTIPVSELQAAGKAAALLAETGSAQRSDCLLDRACFQKLRQLAEESRCVYLQTYVRAMIDAANLRALVRAERMHMDPGFLQEVLFEGGSVTPDAIRAGASEPAALFRSTALREAAELGEVAVKGGSLTDFEKACDNAVLRTAAGARRVPFGVEVALGYLIAKEAEWTAVRIVMAGRLAGLSADAIRERLRDTYV